MKLCDLPYGTTQNKCRSPRGGAWIETPRAVPTCSTPRRRSPRGGAWIETRVPLHSRATLGCRSPRGGAWIETPEWALCPACGERRSPCGGSWIETQRQCVAKRLYSGRSPRGGAWIETVEMEDGLGITQVAPHAGERGLKLDQHRSRLPRTRSLPTRGSVD